MRYVLRQKVRQKKVQRPNLQKRKLLIISILALAASAATPFAAAQSTGSNVIYKSTDKDGNTTYSEKPPATPTSKAKTVELTIDPNQNVLPSEVPRMPASIRQNQNQNQGSDNGATNPIAAAEAALKTAEQALTAGMETQPGDFSGKRGGGVGPSTQRIERINRLQADVDRARENLERVRSGRN